MTSNDNSLPADSANASAKGGFIVSSVEHGLGRVRLNRPDTCNALNGQMVAELVESLQELGRRDVRFGLLEAEGSYFCSGVDVKEGVRGALGEQVTGLLLPELLSSPVLWVACVSGPALAAGLALLAACPLVIASEEVWFAMPESKLGTFPAKLLHYVEPLLGPRRALDLALSGRKLTAKEAEACGFITSAVPKGTEGARCQELIEQLSHVPLVADQARKAWQARFAIGGLIVNPILPI